MTAKRLLLIDDEPEFARFVSHAAEAAGYEAITTFGADAFHREYDRAEPQALVLDLAIPGGDGVELLRFLANRGCRAPVILVSGFDRRVIESAMRLGEAHGLDMAGQVEKPVRIDALISLLRGLDSR
jgi:DNA-binding response OmpR family regulator